MITFLCSQWSQADQNKFPRNIERKSLIDTLGAKTLTPLRGGPDMRRAFLKNQASSTLRNSTELLVIWYGFSFDWTQCKRPGQGIEDPEWENYDVWIFFSDSAMPRLAKGGKRLRKDFGRRIDKIITSS